LQQIYGKLCAPFIATRNGAYLELDVKLQIVDEVLRGIVGVIGSPFPKR